MSRKNLRGGRGETGVGQGSGRGSGGARASLPPPPAQRQHAPGGAGAPQHPGVAAVGANVLLERPAPRRPVGGRGWTRGRAPGLRGGCWWHSRPAGARQLWPVARPPPASSLPGDAILLLVSGGSVVLELGPPLLRDCVHVVLGGGVVLADLCGGAGGRAAAVWAVHAVAVRAVEHKSGAAPPLPAAPASCSGASRAGALAGRW